MGTWTGKWGWRLPCTPHARPWPQLRWDLLLTLSLSPATPCLWRAPGGQGWLLAHFLNRLVHDGHGGRLRNRRLVDTPATLFLKFLISLILLWSLHTQTSLSTSSATDPGPGPNPSHRPRKSYSWGWPGPGSHCPLPGGHCPFLQVHGAGLGSSWRPTGSGAGMTS